MKNFLVIIAACLALACGSDEENTETGSAADNFDRKALLVNVADNIIIPAYDALHKQTIVLNSATKKFLINPDLATFDAYREIWQSTYFSYQRVAFFDIGKTEAISYHNFMNVYPVSTADIELNITTEKFDLGLASEQDEQGFAALDYMLYGLDTTDEGIIARYTTDVNASKYKAYLQTLVTRILDLTETVTLDWKNDYRVTFINNDGSSATSSLNKLVNDYLYYFEKQLRAGKIGIPAGVFSAGKTFPEKTEAFYNSSISKELFLTSLKAVQDFYNGTYYDGSAQGESLSTYVTYLNTIKKDVDLNTIINQQFDDARALTQKLDADFATQIKTGNTDMLKTYDVLQKNVITMKVDLLSALSIKVDYVDADGD